jgi:putative ABC transport system permease protein
MGFTRIMILSFILGESLVMSAIGGILGVIIFVLTFNPLKSFLATTPMGGLAKGLAFYPETILLAIIVSMMVGIFSAIIPAIGSSRRSIREGLRYIG